ncbi:MAG: hypothetical protein ACM3ZE_27100, partial [Myxococcales bacterium]
RSLPVSMLWRFDVAALPYASDSTGSQSRHSVPCAHRRGGKSHPSWWKSCVTSPNARTSKRCWVMTARSIL